MNYLDLQDIEKFLNNEPGKELALFFIDCIKKHTFITKRCLANDFLSYLVGGEPYRILKDLYKTRINHKFVSIIRQGINL